MKAVLNGTVVAESPDDKLIRIEGNWYFPPASVRSDLLVESETPYVCSWKGECQYFDLHDGQTLHPDRAWSYPTPIPSSFDKVGQDYSGYVAFARDIDITE
jgi:uncharacterized protein (DUF427 family)